ncbi:DUF2169 family type VI secretion system accessory protein [Roseibium sediminicola]|uniref:Pentapeptide repeat-containing protein n=1 Tax=Roseibium sediminicola TaxID=2933272 RepID=A0ABT0GX32_9HYPH|nr:DUF2169 domain-containing protein [Roseibium sp. CAU 1639]MCK7613997.1 pentapeptide repeat-containing protein [Roseibium sp. CAU 1639]
MPDLYKPHKLSCIQNIQAIGGQHYLYATVFFGFDLTDPESVLSEAVYTETAMSNLPMGGFLDMGFPKGRPEVLIAGEARAPEGSTVQAQEIGFAVGTVKKRAMVFGDRHWVRDNGDVKLTSAEPYAAMPLTADRAFGNETHPVNPAGKGANPHYILEQFGYAPLPNIENPDRLIKTLTDLPEPVLFGPLGHEHPLRRSKVGQPSWDWIRTSFPEPPPGFDRAYYNVAPGDQRLGTALVGNEDFAVWGMSAQHPVIRSRLPGLRVRLFAVHDTKANHLTEIGTRIETLWLFGSSEIGGLYHRGVLRIADEKASDVVALIFGAERMTDAPRDPSYYAGIYRLRTDSTEGALHTLNDSQLMPELKDADREAMDARSTAFSEEIARKFEKKIQFEHADMLKKANMPAMLTPDVSLPPVPRLPLPAPEDVLAGNVDLAGMFRKLGSAAGQMEADLMKGPAATIAKHRAAGLPLPDDMLDVGRTMKAALQSGDANAAKVLKEAAKGQSVARDVAKYASAAVDMSTANPPVATPPFEEVMPGAVEEALAKIDAVLGKIDQGVAGGEGEEQLWQLVRARALALPEADPFYELKQSLEAMSADMKAVSERPKSGEMVTIDEALNAPEFLEPKPTDFDKVLEELATMPAKNKANQDKLEAILAEKLPKTAGHDLPPSLALARQIESMPVPKPDVTSVDDIIAKAEAATSMDAASFFEDLDEEAKDFLLNQEHARSAMLEAVHPIEAYTPAIRKQLGDLVVEHLAKGESFARRDIANAHLAGADLSGLDLNGVFLEKADLSGANLERSLVTGAALTEATLTEANATGADFSRSSLSGVTAERACMDQTRFENRTWSSVNFQGATFRGAVFNQIVFLESSLAGADFEGAHFVDCLFLHCDFSGARLRNAAFEKTMIVECELAGTDWSGTRFDRQLMTKVTARGSRWSNASFSKSTFVGASDLKGSYFNGLKGHYSSFLEANLDETCFLRADMRDCLFLKCEMSGVDFRAARARKAVFNDSVLVFSDFFAADLMEAHLSQCDARYTSFRGANLYSANLMDAIVQCADFSQANLGQTILELPSANDT